MMRQAMNIHHKRETWQLRIELRAADKAAREACAHEKPFVCNVQTPCGTGDCRFAESDFTRIGNVPFKQGKVDKPQGGTSCDSDAAVESLRKLKHS